MSQLEKLYKKCSKRPTPSDITFFEADRLLRAFGFIQRQSAGGTSHFIYNHPELDDLQITIPKHGKTIKKFYVKTMVDAINKIKEIGGEDIE
ncbi:MAG: type II toxin-antitoxin system HicA family toxin [Halanaerobiales bacterium]|nr:type II toxin-antitoxin system HicA family toxin [Halanaerobiales bacterium]